MYIIWWSLRMKGSLVFLFCFLFRIDWKVIYINLKKEKIGNVIVIDGSEGEREREFSFYCNALQKIDSKTSRRLIILLFSTFHESLFFLEVSNWIPTPKNEVGQSEISLSPNHFAHVSSYHTFFRAWTCESVEFRHCSKFFSKLIYTFYCLILLREFYENLFTIQVIERNACVKF